MKKIKKVLTRPLKIVFGAPCSGKTTYVKEHKNDNGIVIDLDYIKHALTYNEYHYEIEGNILDLSIGVKSYIVNYTSLN